MTKSRLAATGLLILSFALGGLVGGAATMLADKNSSRPDRREQSRAAYIAQMRQEFLDRLRSELSLTREQEKAVVTVLEQHQPAMDSLWRTVRTQFDAERQAVRQDIRAVLSPEQQAKYAAFLAERDSLHRAREGRRDQTK